MLPQNNGVVRKQATAAEVLISYVIQLCMRERNRAALASLLRILVDKNAHSVLFNCSPEAPFFDEADKQWWRDFIQLVHDGKSREELKAYLKRDADLYNSKQPLQVLIQLAKASFERGAALLFGLPILTFLANLTVDPLDLMRRLNQSVLSDETLERFAEGMAQVVEFMYMVFYVGVILDGMAEIFSFEKSMKDPAFENLKMTTALVIAGVWYYTVGPEIVFRERLPRNSAYNAKNGNQNNTFHTTISYSNNDSARIILKRNEITEAIMQRMQHDHHRLHADTVERLAAAMSAIMLRLHHSQHSHQLFLASLYKPEINSDTKQLILWVITETSSPQALQALALCLAFHRNVEVRSLPRNETIAHFMSIENVGGGNTVRSMAVVKKSSIAGLIKFTNELDGFRGKDARREESAEKKTDTHEFEELEHNILAFE